MARTAAPGSVELARGGQRERFRIHRTPGLPGEEWAARRVAKNPPLGAKKAGGRYETSVAGVAQTALLSSEGQRQLH